MIHHTKAISMDGTNVLFSNDGDERCHLTIVRANGNEETIDLLLHEMEDFLRDCLSSL
jgi:hypothetical protein